MSGMNFDAIFDDLKLTLKQLQNLIHRCRLCSTSVKVYSGRSLPAAAAAAAVANLKHAFSIQTA